MVVVVVIVIVTVLSGSGSDSSSTSSNSSNGNTSSINSGNSMFAFKRINHWAISRFSQCPTTSVTKAVVCVIMSVG